MCHQWYRLVATCSLPLSCQIACLLFWILKIIFIANLQSQIGSERLLSLPRKTQLEGGKVNIGTFTVLTLNLALSSLCTIPYALYPISQRRRLKHLLLLTQRAHLPLLTQEVASHNLTAFPSHMWKLKGSAYGSFPFSSGSSSTASSEGLWGMPRTTQPDTQALLSSTPEQPLVCPWPAIHQPLA